MKLNEVPALRKGPAPKPDRNPFAEPPPIEQDLQAVDDFGLPPVLAVIERLTASGREEHRRSLARRLTDRQHIALTLTGLTDQPFTLEPAVPAVGEPPSGGDTLRRRLQRVHSLLIQLKSEKAGKL
jgi:hypothetical protein